MLQQTSDSQGMHKANAFAAPKRHLLTLGIVALFLAACIEAPSSRDIPSTLDVHGEGARIIGQEWGFLFWTGTAIVFLVTAILLAILIRHLRTPRNLSADPRESPAIRWIWLGGIALPVVILVLTFGTNVRGSAALSAPPREETATINITAHRWWWEIEYPGEGVKTANQLYVPVGEPVRINLNSADVIHSFWVPQLHFKRDLIPGQTNSTWLQANEPGVYRGICAEFCGQQHAQMMLMVIALTPERYQAWVADESKPAASPNDDLARAGQQVFLSSACVYCHAIRGTPATGETGPDLTHLASRLTIAAGALENNTGNLGGWIMDPQHMKPGSAMPATPLTGEELQALLAYLNSLQ